MEESFKDPTKERFPYTVEITHGDRSVLCIHNANIVLEKDREDPTIQYLTVCSEHIMPITIHLADIRQYKNIDPMWGTAKQTWDNPDWEELTELPEDKA